MKIECTDCGKEILEVRSLAGATVHLELEPKKVWCEELLVKPQKFKIMKAHLGYTEHQCDPVDFKKKFYEAPPKEKPKKNKTEVKKVKKRSATDEPKEKGAKKKKKKKTAKS